VLAQGKQINTFKLRLDNEIQGDSRHSSLIGYDFEIPHRNLQNFSSLWTHSIYSRGVSHFLRRRTLATESLS
jgi:hypothetical protein